MNATARESIRDDLRKIGEKLIRDVEVPDADLKALANRTRQLVGLVEAEIRDVERADVVRSN